MMLNQNTSLMGYDDRSVVYEEPDFIVRTIAQDYEVPVLELFDMYSKHELYKLGVVHTNIMQHVPLLLQHHKHRISYPFEWTATMYKDAVLLHLDLFINLEKYNLTLKDALPNNIVFDFCKPMFIDFCSLIKKNKLAQEDWLFKVGSNTHDDLRLFIFEKMFVPYMLMPFLLMHENRLASARNMLFDQACNTFGNPPAWHDLTLQSVGFKDAVKRWLKMYRWRSKLLPVKNRNFIDHCTSVRDFVASSFVGNQESDYASYYEVKRENFDFNDQAAWKEKQHGVYHVLQSDSFKTVLDIGANTGWFSLLAAQQGCEVIATDIDEASIDSLYRYSKERQLKILPLLLSFQDLEKYKYGRVREDAPVNSIARPLFLPATQRLESDLVLCLALIHHLVLGQNVSFTSILSTLSQLTKKVLVIEFVGLDDELIRTDPSFFPHLIRYTQETYNIDKLVAESKKFFELVDILPSHPKTRQLVVLRRLR